MFNVAPLPDVEKCVTACLKKELELHTKNALSKELKDLRTNLQKQFKADMEKFFADMKVKEEAEKTEKMKAAAAAAAAGPAPEQSSRQLLRRGGKKKKTTSAKEAKSDIAEVSMEMANMKNSGYQPVPVEDTSSGAPARTIAADVVDEKNARTLMNAGVLEERLADTGIAVDPLKEHTDLKSGSEMPLLGQVEQSQVEILPASASPEVNEIVTNRIFEPVCGAFVMLNAALIGIQCDYEARLGPGSTPDFLHKLDTLFFFIFSVELTLRIMSRGPYDFFFGNPGWAFFDSFMVGIQLIDEVVKLMPESIVDMQHGMNISVLRLLRILRILRITRALRMLRLFEVLSNVVATMATSVGPAFWALILLMMLVYVFSVLFLQIVNSAAGESEELNYYFGGMGTTVLTLFESIVGGVEWEHIVNLLIVDISPFMGFLFSAYITLGLFVVMNLVSGVFLDKVTRTVREDKDDTIKERITAIFADINKGVASEQMEISWEDFAGHLKKPALQEYFRSIDIEPTETEARGLFDLLDIDGGGMLTPEEIVSGCLRLRGPARALEMSLVLRDVGNIHNLADKVQMVDSKVHGLVTNIETIKAKLDKVIPDDEEGVGEMSMAVADLVGEAGEGSMVE
eukprot:TRINITY_DN31747_c0_g1_i1.p1 TRINITY_DN31747_c0_g1~~TRINITY_DN31747_c0_g1_i1.p1  ORF type:complete len:627 (+),score=202.44 TRINITY_DN31747_c0_g1_i1:92-1972(+)